MAKQQKVQQFEFQTNSRDGTSAYPAPSVYPAFSLWFFFTTID